MLIKEECRIDTIKLIDDYISQADWRVKENSNANYSFAGLQAHIADSVLVNWALNKMCAGEIGWAHDDGFFHIHDLSHPNVGYCAGWSTEQLIKEGFNCGTGYEFSSPPHHLRTLCDQIVNFIFTMSGEWAGAQAFNCLDTYCAAYIKYEDLSDKEIYDILESLVYGLNNKERVGMQSPFTNFSFDIYVPKDLANTNCWIGEKQVDFTYGDCQEEMYRFNKIFAEVMINGDAAKKPFTFPIVTYSITPDFPWDSDIAESIFTFADKMNSPYFSNFINSDQSPDDIRSMCPLTPDTKIRIRLEDGTVYDEAIGNLPETFFVYYYGKWKRARAIKAEPQKTVKITDLLGKTIEMGEYHQHSVIECKDDQYKVITIPAKDVKPGHLNMYDSLESHDQQRAVEILNVQYGDKIRDDLWCVEVIDNMVKDDETYRLFTLSNGLVTHNCRLRLDLREMIKKSGGLFGSGDKTGSIGVVTLNLPKMAYIAKNRDFKLLERYDIKIPENATERDIYFHLIEYFCDLAKDSLLIKRSNCIKMLNMGMLPYTKRYLGDYDHHFNTIGVCGGHEACLNLLGEGIETPAGQQFMVDTLNFILNKCADYQEQYQPLMFNLEATPAESASTRFARKDKRLHPGIITGAGTGGDFYTNSTQLPENYSDNIFAVFEHQDALQPLYTSGTVQHIYLHESTNNWRVIQSLVKKLFTNYRLPYLSISPNISVCPICGKLDGYYEVCPNEHTEEQIQKALEAGILTKDDIVN